MASLGVRPNIAGSTLSENQDQVLASKMNLKVID